MSRFGLGIGAVLLGGIALATLALPVTPPPGTGVPPVDLTARVVALEAEVARLSGVVEHHDAWLVAIINQVNFILAVLEQLRGVISLLLDPGP